MGVRIAELVGGLSLATDMGAGQPLQSAIAATILATRMAARLGLDEADRSATYYGVVLRFIGCTSVASDAAQMAAGDEMSFNYAFGMADMADPAQVADALDRYWAKGTDDQVRRDVIRTISESLAELAGPIGMHCAQAVVLSRRIPVGDRVPHILGYMYDRFDGVAAGHGGEDIPVPARLASIAAHTAIAVRSLGKRTALDLILPRKGGQFCPECIALLESDHETLLDGLDAPSCWEGYLDHEPGAPRVLDADAIDKACTAYADYADQKSGYLLGHSRHVAKLAFLAAEAVGLDLEARRRLRLAALLHDVGRAGVPSGLWDKPGTLTTHERQIVESHNGHTETILRLAPALRELCERAAAVHERSDKTGYPRATALDDVATGILAASDVYQALTHDRPWRLALAPAQAADLLIEQAREGRLPRKAVSAVLDAAGHARKTADDAYPAGLSRREVEVLALLAQGLGTKQIADRLAIAPKTAENHIGRIYDKTNARGRAAAALYAVEHGLNDYDLAPEPC